MEFKATVEIAAQDESWTSMLPSFESKGFSCVVTHPDKSKPIPLSRADFVIVDTGFLAPWQAIMLWTSHPFLSGRIAMTHRSVDGGLPDGILLIFREDMVDAIDRQFILLGRRVDA